jgi:hypothetical protein
MLWHDLSVGIADPTMFSRLPPTHFYSANIDPSRLILALGHEFFVRIFFREMLLRLLNCRGPHALSLGVVQLSLAHKCINECQLCFFCYREPASALPAAGSQPTNGPKPADTAKATNPTNYYAAIADVGENVPEVVRPKSSGADKASFDLKEQTLTEDELLEERKKCMHEVCLPPGYDPATAPKPTKQPPAKTYPFNLDPFQRVRVFASGLSFNLPTMP